MNLFSLVFKQMRQRALSTWLTLLSVTLGVALAIAIIILGRESQTLFGQHDYAADLIIGKKGSATQLVMNTVYHLDVSPGNLPYSLYRDMKTKYRSMVKIAAPIVVGDSYNGIYRIVGTTPNVFGYGDDGQKLPDDEVLGYGPDKFYEFAEGGVFAPNRFQAVIGSDVAKLTDLKMGTKFRATHGMAQPGVPPDIHKTVWTVVGILKPTHTANDRCVFIPYKSLYTIGEHSIGMLAQMYIREGKPAPPSDVDPDDIKDYYDLPDGTFELMKSLPEEAYEVSAIMIKARSPFMASSLQYVINNGDVAQAAAPAQVMQQFFDTFLKGPTLVLLVVALLVTVVAGVSILVSIYNSVSARLREIAILRALGATRTRVLLLICVESGLIGLFGGILGLVVGHLTAGVGSIYFVKYMGQGINWVRTGRYEWYYVVAVVIIALIAGLVPALKAYRTPVATNLSAV